VNGYELGTANLQLRDGGSGWRLTSRGHSDKVL